MKEEIGYTVTGRGGGKMEAAFKRMLKAWCNPTFMAVNDHPECDTLIINDKDWERLDEDIRDEIDKRVTVKPTGLVDEGKAYLLKQKDLEIDYLKHPFEPLW